MEYVATVGLPGAPDPILPGELIMAESTNPEVVRLVSASYLIPFDLPKTEPPEDA